MARALPSPDGMRQKETFRQSPVETFPPSEFSARPFRPSMVPAGNIKVSQRHLNKFFKALADETRREILVLLQSREHTVGEIVDRFTLSQPTISRHLSVLKEANLVTDQRKGQFVLYRLSGTAMARTVRDFFDSFIECREQATGAEG
jgi:DNA-binding transcriptional ArsR family regulator